MKLLGKLRPIRRARGRRFKPRSVSRKFVHRSMHAVAFAGSSMSCSTQGADNLGVLVGGTQLFPTLYPRATAPFNNGAKANDEVLGSATRGQISESLP